MIDFSLNDEQIIMRDTVRKFIMRECRALDEAVDNSPDPDALLDERRKVAKEALRLGFGKTMIPREYGGYGGSLMDAMIIEEEFARGSSTGLFTVASATNMLSQDICIGGTEEQKDKWLTLFDEDNDGKYFLAGTYTEPSGGSEVVCPLPDPSLGVQTTAIKEGDYYIINGSKCFSTGPNLHCSELKCILLVLARTDKTKANVEGCSLFLIPADTPGVILGKNESKLGLRSQTNCDVVYENVKIPKDNLIGKENSAFSILAEGTRRHGGGLLLAARCIGAAQGAYEEVLTYANDRIIWGKPIGKYESIAHKLVNMRTKIEVMRAYAWKMAWALENPEKSEGLSRISQTAKVFCSYTVREILMDAFDIMGGYSYFNPSRVQKYLRDTMQIVNTHVPNPVLLTMTALNLTSY